MFTWVKAFKDEYDQKCLLGSIVFRKNMTTSVSVSCLRQTNDGVLVDPKLFSTRATRSLFDLVLYR